ncbi:hypothetical protein FHG87_001304 [Trinorchestia longiramus]|nr:hypothetical protein FHG87_001304 [Trinorchestia longiramus]
MNATNEQKIFHDLFPIKRSKTHGFSISTSTKPFLASDPFHAGHTFSVVLPSESSATSKNRLYKQSAHNHSAQIAVEKNKWTRHTRSAGQDLVETRKTSSTESTQLERSQYSSKKKPALPDCKDKQDLDNCLEKALLNLSVAGLPHTKEQLLHVCGAFKRGMSCVDAFTSRCFSEERRNEFEENLASVRGFLAFLCDDPVFQRDYLSHGSCISKVGVHWQGCNDRFKYLVGKELRRSPSDLVGDTRRWRSICCLRHKFLTCVYHVGLSYCTQEDAIFLRKVSSALSHNSAKQLNCDSTTACSGCQKRLGLVCVAGCQVQLDLCVLQAVKYG